GHYNHILASVLSISKFAWRVPQMLANFGIGTLGDFRFLSLAVMTIGAAMTASWANAAELQIVNTSGKAIHEFYLAASGDRSWGLDRLRQKRPSVIALGETYTIANVTPGAYQIMLVDADGSECQIDFVDIKTDYRIDLTSGRLRECTTSH